MILIATLKGQYTLPDDAGDDDDDTFTRYSGKQMTEAEKRMLRSKSARSNGAKTKQENLLPKILPGTVCAQMIRCGKPTCKCSRGELHGTYYYHFMRVGGRLRKRYLKPDEVEAVRAACIARRTDERAKRTQTRQALQSVRVVVAKLRDIQWEF